MQAKGDNLMNLCTIQSTSFIRCFYMFFAFNNSLKRKQLIATMTLAGLITP